MAEVHPSDQLGSELARTQQERDQLRREQEALRAELRRMASELEEGRGRMARLQQADQRLSVLYTADRVLAKSRSLADAMPPILEAMGRSEQWQLGILWRADPATGVLRYAGGWQDPGLGAGDVSAQWASMVFPPGFGLPGKVWESCQPRWIPDVQADPEFVRTLGALHAGLHAAFFFPIWSMDRVLGVIEFFSREVRKPDEAQIDLFMSISRQLGQYLDRKQAELDLRRALATLKAQQEASIDGILVVDEFQHVTSYNECFLHLWGLSPAVMESRDDRQLLARVAPQLADPEAFLARVADLYRNPLEASHEEIRLKDGRVLDRYSAPAISAEGQYFGRTWFYRDITERKHAEASLSRLAAIVQSSEDAIIGKTLEGIITDWNPAAERIYGYPAELAIGQPVSIVYPADLQAEVTAILDQIRQGKAIEHCETQRRRRDGTLLDVSISVSPIKDAAGRIVGAATITRDITERKRMEQALQAQVEQLRELDRLKGIFVNTVTHELRTPLTSIRGYLEFLEDGLGGPLTDKEREFLAQIRRSEERLERLVTDLLEFARLEGGTFKLACEEGDLAERIGSCVDSLRPLAMEGRLQVEVAVPPEPLTASMDTQRVGQVLLNLLGNAIKFTPPGGRIVVSGRREAGRVVAEVTDTGPGIPPEDVPRLFKRFSQLEGGMRKGGTGLGLSISKALVEAHGGEIGVRSVPGAGSTFWFSLPTV